ncbi:MAG: DnaA N-terminal domain-containing protein [Dehalococcoidia bacterium]
MRSGGPTPRDTVAWQQVLPVPYKENGAQQKRSAVERRQHAPASDARRDGSDPPAPELVKRLGEYWGIPNAEWVVWRFGNHLVHAVDVNLTEQLENGWTTVRTTRQQFLMFILWDRWKRAQAAGNMPEKVEEPQPEQIAEPAPRAATAQTGRVPAASVQGGEWTEDEVARELWTQVLDALRNKIPRPNFKAYLADTFAHSLIGDTLTIVAPSQFAAEALERHLSATISRELERQRGSPVNLWIEVGVPAKDAEDYSDVSAVSGGSLVNQSPADAPGGKRAENG